MLSIETLTHEFNRFLSDLKYDKTPASLYLPINYLMDLGGKRIRPVLLLAAYNLYSDSIAKAMHAAYAVELFHNFTLMHDDIMDQADLRRGSKTVHIQFGVNDAILSGDVMMMYVYKILTKYENPEFKRIIGHFTDTAIRICEGQRMDMDFETRNDVSIQEYFTMIEYKTAILLAESMYLGALMGGASEEDLHHMFEYGKNLGIAFQIQDDFLDTYGDQQAIGKRVGGDILQKKKTYLYVKTRELLEPDSVRNLDDCYFSDTLPEEQRISLVMKYFGEVNVKEYALQVIEAYTQLAVSHLASISASSDRKSTLEQFSRFLEFRKH